MSVSAADVIRNITKVKKISLDTSTFCEAISSTEVICSHYGIRLLLFVM